MNIYVYKLVDGYGAGYIERGEVVETWPIDTPEQITHLIENGSAYAGISEYVVSLAELAKSTVEPPVALQRPVIVDHGEFRSLLAEFEAKYRKAYEDRAEKSRQVHDEAMRAMRQELEYQYGVMLDRAERTSREKLNAQGLRKRFGSAMRLIRGCI